mgnify:CR=1 FL=1
MNEQRNLYLAIGISIAIIIFFQLLFPTQPITPPTSVDDIIERGKAYYEWATWSNGMFGRTPDYKNASIMSFSLAKAWLDSGNEKGIPKGSFSENMQNYYDYVRLNDKIISEISTDYNFLNSPSVDEIKKFGNLSLRKAAFDSESSSLHLYLTILK